MNDTFFQWARLKHLYQNHHTLKGAWISSTDKLSSKEIYSILISNILTNLPQSSISKNCLKKQF